MIELIVSDMDGTLLNHHFSISSENIQSIHTAVANGVPFVIATGRHLTEAQPLLAAHNIHCPIITVNGAAIYDSNGTLLDMHPIDTQRVLQTIEKAQKYSGIIVDIVTLEGVTSDNQVKRETQLQAFIRSHNPNLSDEEAIALFAKQRENFPAHYVPSLENFIRSENPTILKMIVMTSEHTDQLSQLKQELTAFSDIVVTSSNPLNIEINAPLAQKGIAVKNYATSHGMSLQNVLALGDNDNDASMLTTVGYGIAMANAAQHIQQLAYATTDSNEHNGVAHAIQKYVLNNLED